MEIQSAKIKYQEQVLPALQKELGVKSVMAVPKITKVVVNVGIGRINKETAVIDEMVEALREITGQQPVKTKAKKAISGFKIRQGLEIGIKVTLRGNRMWQFIDRMINTAIPRIKDFQGLKQSTIDSKGNMNIGLKEHIVFPEISPEKVRNIFGLQINVTTTAKNHEDGKKLLTMLGFPIQK